MASVDPTDGGLNGFGGGAEMMMKRLQYLVGPRGRKEGRKEGYMNMIAPPSHLMPRRVRGRTYGAKTDNLLLGESFNLSGGANSK